MFHQMLLEFFSIKLKLPTPVYTDSSGVLSYVQKPGATSLNKHFAKFLGLARDQQLNLVSVAVHMAGDDQIADILTKATTKVVFLKLRALILGGRDSSA